MSDKTDDNVTIHYHRSFPTTLTLFVLIANAAWQSGFIAATALVLIVFNIVQTQRLRNTVNSLKIKVEDGKKSGNFYKERSEQEGTSSKQPQELDASLAFDGEEIFNMLSTVCRELFTELAFVLHVVIWYCSSDTQNSNRLESNHLDQETERTPDVESEGVPDTNETSSVEGKPDILGNGESAYPDHVEVKPDLQGNGESATPDHVKDEPNLRGNAESASQDHVEDKSDLQGNGESVSSDHVEDKSDLQGNLESVSSNHVKDEPNLRGNLESASPDHVKDEPDLRVNVESVSSNHVEDEPDLQGHGESGSPDQLESQLGIDALEEYHRPSETLESYDPISTDGFGEEPLTFGSFDDMPLFGSSTSAILDLQDLVVLAEPQISEKTPSAVSSSKSSIELVALSPVNLSHPILDSNPPRQPISTPGSRLREQVKVVPSLPAAGPSTIPDTELPGLKPYFFHEIPTSFASNNGQQVPDTHLLKLQDSLRRLSPNNVDKIFQELQDVITENSKQLTECANIFVEKGVTEAVNQTVVIACAKVIAYIIQYPKNGGLKMLATEISNSLFATVALLLELEFDSQPSCFVMELVTKVALTQSTNQKLIKGIVRFASELFLHDVVEMEELKDRLIDPLLVKRTNRSMEIVCQILTCTGHRIKRQSTQKSDLVKWYSQLFKKLEAEIQDSSFDNETVQFIQRVIELENNGWDQYVKPELEPQKLVQEPSPSLVNSVVPANKKKKKKPKKSNLNEENLAKAACQNVPVSTTLHGEIPVVSSDSSSVALSPASSVSSLPGCHLQSKLIVDIDAKRVLANFMVEMFKPEARIMQWLKSQFEDCEEKRIRDFVRNVGRLIRNPRQATEASQIGYLLHLMMKGHIISEDQVIRGLMSGIVSDLPMYHRDTTKDFLSLNKNTAILVVRCWEQRMEDLSWLTALGRQQQRLNKSTWEYFSLAVLNLLSSRMTLEGARKLFHNTQNKEALFFAAAGVNVIESQNI